MKSIKIVAKNEIGYVIEENDKYARIKIKDGITKNTRWHETDAILHSSLVKGGYDEVDPPEEYIDKVEKSRKSVNRIDEGKEIKGKRKKGLSLMIENLGLENFEKDLVSNKVVRKSSQNSLTPDLMIDLEKAGDKHLPKGSERYAYRTPSKYGIIYIPVNRLRRVYQSEDASNKKKINNICAEFKKNTIMEPIEIGYNYDVHDGHHRWDASIKAGYTHVPCKVVGDNPKKIKQAKKEYRKLWKSMDKELTETLDNRLRDLILFNLTDEDEAVQAYAEIISLLEDGKIKDIILEIMEDELDHYHNLSQVLRFIEGDTTAIDEENMLKSLELVILPKESTSIPLVIDLAKSEETTGPKDGKLNKAKLVQMRIPVRGKNGQTFYRMQWIDPSGDIPKGAQPTKENKSSYAHSKKGIKEMEKRQSNKFPIIHYPTKDLKNTKFNYQVNKAEYDAALKQYYNGEELPLLKISPTGEIIENHHLVDLAKELGISHVPSVVVGNPRLKKELEDRMKDKVVLVDDESGEEEELTGRKSKVPAKELTKEIMADTDYFTNVLKKKYPTQYLMDEAKKQGITWKTDTKDGRKLPAESQILWLRAHQAIIDHIEDGNEFVVTEDKKITKEYMTDKGKDGIESHFLTVMKNFDYNKDDVLEHARTTGISWKEQKDPDMNWMYGSMAIKNHMRAGGMFAGVRSRQKILMDEQAVIVTDQIRESVTEIKESYGKHEVMDRANTLGITWVKENKKGVPYPPESRILWMNAHQAIAWYIAEGNTFTMSDEPENDGLASTVNENPYDLTPGQLLAMDVGRRNTKAIEKESKNWALKAFQVDRGASQEEAEELYGKFMENARNAKVKIQFNPFEILPSGVNLIDQIISEGEWKNDYEYQRGYDYEHKGSNENDMFTDDYWDTPDKERPVYGIIDLFNQGNHANILGDVNLVMKDSIKKRSTGSHVDADNIPYGQEGKTIRSMEDPHHLIIDRWRSRWKNINKKDGQRTRAMNAVVDGDRNLDDMKYFETHIHGGINISEDVDYITVPTSWKNNKDYSSQLSKIQELANLVGTSVKYE